MSRTTLAGLARRCPWGLVGMVALVLVVEAAIDGRARSLFDMEDIAFRWTGRAASVKTKRAEILCFGDSLIKLSVIPSVVQERTGKRVYNLAISGSQAPSSYFLLKRALDAGSRPEAVVVDFNPPLLRIGPRHITTRWGAMLGPLEAAELAWWARDADLFGEVALGELIPSLRGKTTIRANLKEALVGGHPTMLDWNKLAIRNWGRNDGAQLMVGSAAAQNLPDAEIQRLREGYYPEWSCHPANVEGVDHFLALAARHKIRVFWVLAPVIPPLHDKIAESGIDARHDEFLRGWQAKYPDLVILDARRKVTEVDAFWDPQHLSVIGASAFSRTLGDVLRRTIGGKLEQRWVAMPEIKVGPLAPGIENINQSRLALDAIAKARR
jgi:hypothetical protein